MGLRLKFDLGGTGGEAVTYRIGTIVHRGVIYIWSNLLERGTEGVTTHEFGHIFLTSQHPDDPFNKSIMSASLGGRTTAGEWDEKYGKILYHELKFGDGRLSHFIANDGGILFFDARENILGLNFGPEGKQIHKFGKYWHGK